MLKPVIDKDSVVNFRLLMDLRFARKMSLPPSKSIIIFGKPLSCENLVYHMTIQLPAYKVLLLANLDNFNGGTLTLLHCSRLKSTL